MAVMDYATPERSLQQRLDALRRANETRTYRSRLKADLKAGRVTFAEVLGSDDERLSTMKVFDVLMALEQVGRTKSLKILHRAQASPSKTIGGLTGRQRGALVAIEHEVRAYREHRRLLESSC